MHVAGLMAKKFDLDPETTRIVRLAALVHDIGHGPFGHVTEDAFEALHINRGDETTVHKFHEHITAKIIRSQKHLGKYLEQDAERIADILDPKKTDPCIEKDIVSGPLDADKIDYLRRDSYFCGVEYGAFDFHKLLRVLTAPQVGDIRSLRIEHDGVHCIEQFVVAKYFINYQVYRHRIRLITDAMLVRAVELSFKENSYVNTLYSFNNSSEESFNNYLDTYLNSDDTKLLDEGANNPSEGQTLFKMLRNRDLLKRVFHCNASELLPNKDNKEKVHALKKLFLVLGNLFGGTSKHDTSAIKKLMEKHHKELIGHSKEIETRIAEHLHVEKNHCILKIYPIKFDRGKEIDAGKVMVLQQYGEPKTLDECTEICTPTEAKLRQMNIDVYAPPINNNTYTLEALSKIRGPVMEILKEYFKDGGSENVVVE